VNPAGPTGPPPSDLYLAVELLKIVESWKKSGIPLTVTKDALLLAACSIAQMQRMRRRELLKAAYTAFGRVKDAEEKSVASKQIIVPGHPAYS
jgi:hypothetical protein